MSWNLTKRIYQLIVLLLASSVTHSEDAVAAE